MPDIMTLEEYLAQQNLSMPISDFTLDKTRNPHGLTQRKRKALEEDTLKNAREYHAKREEAIKEFERKVQTGEIIEKTKEQKLIERARYGHPDNEQTQAARRVCEKRGLVWAL